MKVNSSTAQSRDVTKSAVGKFIFLLTVLVALSCGICSAEVRTFHAESSYYMDKGKSIKDAKSMSSKTPSEIFPSRRVLSLKVSA